MLLGLGLVVSTFAFATPANAQSASDLQAQVQALLAQIAALQGGQSTAACVTFTQNLRFGARGGEVMAVQKFLNSNSDTRVSATGAGSPGNETSYFGGATRAAVIKFQNKYAADILTPNGLSSGNGNWYTSTRAKANALCAAGGNTGGNNGGNNGGGTTAGTLVVGAGVQPANSLAPQGARVPFTTFTLTNTSNTAVTVNGVTVQRTGLGQDAAFSGIVLTDSNGVQMGTSKTLNSNHQATVGDNFTINPGQSMTLTVVGTMNSSLSSYAGQVVGLSVVGVNSTATVSGSLPITGAQQTINSTLAIGSISTSTSAFDPASASSRSIGDTAVRFSGVKFTAGSNEDLKLMSIRWRQVGSASASDLANVVTVVEGTTYPTTIDSTGKYYTTVFPAGITVTKGSSIDAYVQGDLVGSNSAARTIDFDIDRNTDVYFVGQTYGYGIVGSGTNTPWYNGYVVTIQAGTLTTISKANEVGAQNIAVNVSNQPLGGYATNFSGEPVMVQSQVFTIATSSAATGLLTSVSLVDENGRVVAGPVDATWSSGSMIVTFTDTVTYPTGRHVFTLKGKVPSSASNGAQITVSTTPSSQWTNVTGANSGSTVTLSGAGTVTMNAVTVKGGALNISLSTTPASQTITPGVSGFTFANVVLDASQSGEDVRLASLPITETGFSNDLTGCQIYNGSTALNTGTRVVNSLNGGTKTTFSFDNTIVVPKGTKLTLAVKCNVSSSATTSSTYVFSTDTTAGDYSVTGVGSGTTITPTITSGSSGTMTVGTASFTVAVDNSSPAYSVNAGGNTVTDTVVKLRASNDTVTLTRLGLALGAGTAAADVSLVHLFNAAGTEIGTVSFGTGETQATSTPLNLTLPANTDVRITVKVDLADVGVGQSGTSGDEVRVVPLNAEGTSSSGTVTANATGSVAGVRLYNSFPTISYSTGNATLTNGTVDLLSLSVTADARGDIALRKLTFTISTTTATVATPTFSGPNGNVASTTNVNLNPAGSTITVYFDSASNTSDAVVSAGTTKTYTLRGTVTGAATGASVSVALKADTASSSVTTVAGLASSNIIWSPLSTSTSVDANTNDWVNGYGLPGCFTSSGLGNNCAARVLSL